MISIVALAEGSIIIELAVLLYRYSSSNFCQVHRPERIMEDDASTPGRKVNELALEMSIPFQRIPVCCDHLSLP